MKVILTGGAGFIGSCMLWKLNSMGIADVIVVDTKKDGTSYPTLKKKKFSDYLSREDLLLRLSKGQLADVDLILHLGACTDTTERDENYLRQNNLGYSQTLLEWANTKNKFFHYASSAAIYGDGKKGYSDDPQKIKDFKALNFYGESKRLFDLWLFEKKLLGDIVGFRYFNVFGPNEYHKGPMRSMISKAFDQIKEKGRVQLFASSRPGYADGSEERDFVYVKDVVNVMAYFIEHPDRRGIFNIGTGKARSFKDLVKTVFHAQNKEPQIEYIPMPESLRGQYQYFTQADLSNLRKVGYSVSFQSLEGSVKDYVQNHLIKEDSYL